MAKIWLATQSSDNNCYNLVAPTLKQLESMMLDESHMVWEDVYQLEVRFSSVLDAIHSLCDEGRGKLPSMGKILLHLEPCTTCGRIVTHEGCECEDQM